MARPFARALVVVIAALLAGCRGACGAEQKPAAVAVKETYPWALAEADPGGSTPVDDEVRAAQKRVKQVPKSNDKLIELGRAWVLKARHSHDSGYYLHAAACAERVLKREPKNRLARELLGQVLLSQHQFTETVRLCEEVLADDPEAVITLGIYSDALLELGRVDEAIVAADKMVSAKPNTASYVRVSFFQWMRGDANAALETAKLAIMSSNDPSRPEPRAYALVQAANWFLLRGDYRGADEGYLQALAIFPDFPAALAGRGRAALALGEAARAVPLFEAALAASPLVETAWRLGDARDAAGDAAGAAEARKKAVALGGQDGRTLALFYASSNIEIPEALRLAEAELKTRPGPFTQDAYAWALYRAGRIADAQRAIDAARKHVTKDPSVLFHAGAIALAGGDKKNGEYLLREALALSPAFDHRGAPEARRLLDGLAAK